MKRRTARVIDLNGIPLMPTSRAERIDELLSTDQATVVCYFPYTIRLNRVVERVFIQPLRVGVDIGYKYAGISISTQKKELYSYEFEHRTNEVKKNLETRRDDRINRRHRKTRYRKSRFNNRTKSKKKGWVAPSVHHMVDSHKRDLESSLRYLPVPQSISLEMGKFDTQKMCEPYIEGEMYQQGELTGFDNAKAFVRWRDGNKCQHCKGKSGDKKIEVHHIKRRADGGSDNQNNLVCLCHTCHTKHHNGEIKLKKFNMSLKSANSLRSAAFMNIASEMIFDEIKKMFPYSKIKKTYGYITKHNRIKYNIEKTHSKDALVISGNFNAIPQEHTIIVKNLRRHNRQIHRKNPIKGGIRKRSQAEHFIKGFALNDFVRLDNQATGFITARMSDGYVTIKTIDGERIHEKTVVSMKRIRLIRRAKGIIYDYKYTKCA